jgi:hypothetical protein
VPAILVVVVFLLSGFGQAAGATIYCPTCTGGGGGGGLNASINAYAPYAGGPEACIETTGGLCAASDEPGTLTEPILNPSFDLYATNFYLTGSGGYGGYTYEWDFNTWAPGSLSTTHEFTEPGDYTVGARVLSGTSPNQETVLFSMTVDVTTDCTFSGCNVVGVLGSVGVGISLTQQETQFTIGVVELGSIAVPPLATALCDLAFLGESPPDACQEGGAQLAAYILEFASQIASVDQGKGVCFEFPSNGDPPLLIANPCSSGYWS